MAWTLPPGSGRARTGRRRSAPGPRKSSSSTGWSGSGAGARGGNRPWSGAPLDLDGLLATLAGVHGLDLGLVHLKGLAVTGGELPVERVDRPLQAAHAVLAQRPGVPDGVEDRVVATADEVEELRLEAEIGRAH